MIYEEWKDIEGFEDYYSISNLGNVISKERTMFNGKTICKLKERKLIPPISTSGYRILAMSKNGKKKRGCKNVQKNGNRFSARITINKNNIYLGRTKTKIKAEEIMQHFLETGEKDKFKYRKKGSTPKGVYLLKNGKYQVKLPSKNGKNVYVGTFNSSKVAEEAFLREVNNEAMQKPIMQEA